MTGRWDIPEEPPEAQPPPGIRLDDLYVYQGAVKITYIDDQDEGEDWVAPEVGPEPEPVII